LVGITLREHADAIAVHHHRVTVDAYLARELAVGRVVARQVRVGVGITEIVDRDDLDFLCATALIKCAQHVAPDAPVTVDANLDCHGVNSSVV
jgi:hypothetical protein